jgi:sulfonate transport system substrate-binding protein
MKTPLRHLLTALGLAGTLSALPAAAEPPSQQVIRIAVPDLSAGSKPSAGGVVDVLRDQQLLEKEFAKDGIRIDWRFFKGAGPVVNEALANGQADFAYLGDLAAIIGKANGLDTRVLSAGVRGVKSYLGVVPGSGIHSLADLKGKRVAVFRGTANQLSFASALASQGLSERELKVINLDFNAANAALAAKQIDATWGLSNLLSLRERGLVELPVNSGPRRRRQHPGGAAGYRRLHPPAPRAGAAPGQCPAAGGEVAARRAQPRCLHRPGGHHRQLAKKHPAR